MHVLRSTYLPVYSSLIRQPYSSDPFPHTLPNAYEPTSSPLALQHIQRKTKVLDLFIALKVGQDVYMDDTEFHFESAESFRDLFDFNQSKSRLEDLIRHYGVKERGSSPSLIKWQHSVKWWFRVLHRCRTPLSASASPSAKLASS